MLTVENVTIIEHYTYAGKTQGVYTAHIDGHLKVFVENDDHIGVVVHLLGNPVHKCLLPVTIEVDAELKRTVAELLKVRPL